MIRKILYLIAFAITFAIAAGVAGIWGWLLAHAVIAAWPATGIGQFILVIAGFILWVVGFTLAAILTTEFCRYCFTHDE